MYVSVCMDTRMKVLEEARDVGVPWNGNYRQLWGPWGGRWEQNSSPLQEQQILLTHLSRAVNGYFGFLSYVDWSDLVKREQKSDRQKQQLKFGLVVGCVVGTAAVRVWLESSRVTRDRGSWKWRWGRWQKGEEVDRGYRTLRVRHCTSHFLQKF